MIILRNKILERLLVTLFPYRVIFRDWHQASSEPCPSWKAAVTGPRHRDRGFVKVVPRSSATSLTLHGPVHGRRKVIASPTQKISSCIIVSQLAFVSCNRAPTANCQVFL